jgi:hypothetical protein
LLTFKSENDATPLTAATASVPVSVPEPGFAASATVTVPVYVGVVLPLASCAVTWMVGAIASPAAVLDGCAVNASFATGPGLMVNAELVTAAGGAPPAGVAIKV